MFFSKCGPHLRNVLQKRKEKYSSSQTGNSLIYLHLLKNRNEHLYILSWEVLPIRNLFNIFFRKLCQNALAIWFFFFFNQEMSIVLRRTLGNSDPDNLLSYFQLRKPSLSISMANSYRTLTMCQVLFMCSTYINYFNHHKNPMMKRFLVAPPYYRWKNWGAKILLNLFKLKQLVRGRTGIQDKIGKLLALMKL